MPNPNTFFISLGAICGSIIIAGGLIAGAVVMSGNRQAGSAGIDQAQDQQQGRQQAKEVSFNVSENDPTLGSSDAPVTVVEFSDYGCPFCKRFHSQTFSQLQKQYIEKDKIQYRFKHRPVTQLHPQAKTQAIAAQCVYSLKGDKAFFDYTKRMFKDQDTAKKKKSMISLAEETGVSKDTFTSCFDNQETQEKVEADNSLAQKNGIGGTPSFAIGTVEDGTFTGKLLVGAQPFSKFQSRIDALVN